MIVFWTVCGLLVAGALLLLLPPLLRRSADSPAANAPDMRVSIYRDQLRELENDLASGVLTPERYAEARRELALRVLEETDGVPPAKRAPASTGVGWMAAALALALPAGAFGLYAVLGTPEAAAPGAVARSPAGNPHAFGPEEIERMVAGLADKLKERPEDAEGWHVLARSYTVLGRYRDAVAAYERVTALVEPDATLLADYADVLAMAQGKRLAGEPTRLIQRALAADPHHLKALALAGSAAFEGRDYRGAQFYWERFLQVAPPDSPFTQGVRASLAQARRLAEQPDGAAGPVAPGGTVRGMIDPVQR